MTSTKPMHPSENALTDLMRELQQKLPDELFAVIATRDGAAILADRLPQIFKANEITTEGSVGQRGWELAGLYFYNHGRYYEALNIFKLLYKQLLLGQREADAWVYKAIPQLWLGECYKHLGFPVHSKRHLMLSLCEESVRQKGQIPPAQSGNYFRLVWGSGVAHSDFVRYSKEAYDLFQEHPKDSQFPEWVLQHLDQNWITEFPTPVEAAVYQASSS